MAATENGWGWEDGRSWSPASEPATDPTTEPTSLSSSEG